MESYVDPLRLPGPWAAGLGAQVQVPFVQAEISRCSALTSVGVGGWTFDSLSGVLESWQNKCINGVYDEFRSVHGPFKGVFDFIRDRWSWNARHCRKKSNGYWEMTASPRFSYLHAAGFAALVPEYQDVASRFPLVPAMVWGPAVHATMERPSRGSAELADWAQWWPTSSTPGA